MQTRTLTLWPEPLTHLLIQAAVALGFLAAAELGNQFVLPRANVALVWPAAGLALAVAYKLGPRYLIGIGVGAFIAHYLQAGALIPVAAITAGTVSGAWLGALVLRHGQVEGQLGRLSDVLWLVAGVAVAGTVTSLVGSGVMWLAGMAHWDGFRSLWWICWVADTVGALLLVPVLLSWLTPGPVVGKRVEGALTLAALIAVTWVIYGDALPAGLAMARPLSYLVFPLLIWAAVRLPVREVSLLLLLHAAVALYYTAANHGPFATGVLRESLLALHSHLSVLSVSILLLAAAMCERRRSELALSEREAQYRLLVENQTDYVVKMDCRGRIVFASPSFCALLRQPETALAGRQWRELVQVGDPTAQAAWEQLSKPPYGCYLESPLRTASGERWIGWAAKSMVEEDGAVCAIIAVGRDVTDKRAAEAQARRHLQELAHVGRISAMGELAAGLAHELNQPLCAITSYAQACQRLLPESADPDLRNALERVAANAQRAGGIIGQMRAFVRKDELALQPTDLNQLVEEVVALTQTDARHHAATIERELDAQLPPVHVAPLQIQQVLVNLIRNAVEAMSEAHSPERRVRIRTCSDGEGRVEVSVADTGPGLPAGLAEQVFEPFVTTKAGGMGLGLSISRSIIEAQGGSLTALARPGGGTEFRFTLPEAGD